MIVTCDESTLSLSSKCFINAFIIFGECRALNGRSCEIFISRKSSSVDETSIYSKEGLEKHHSTFRTPPCRDFKIKTSCQSFAGRKGLFLERRKVCEKGEAYPRNINLGSSQHICSFFSFSFFEVYGITIE